MPTASPANSTPVPPTPLGPGGAVPVNPTASEAVCRPMSGGASTVEAAAGSVPRPVAGRGRVAHGSRFGRFLALSTTLHAVLVVAGITGGAAYQRRAGGEALQAVITVAAADAPLLDEVAREEPSEPARPIESSPRPAEDPQSPAETLVEATLEATPEAMPGESPAADEAALASSERSKAIGERSLADVLGDPRASWKLASNGVPGLQVGLAAAPHVSDCCGEPQPAPARPADVYVYPEVVSMARAEFPRQSQRLGEQGTVLLEMRVGTDGLVKDVRVLESSGYVRIDDCAVDAAWAWVFKPATRNGVAEEALAHHRYTFRLTGGSG